MTFVQKILDLSVRLKEGIKQGIPCSLISEPYKEYYPVYEDVDVVIETMRGHNLGRVIYHGQAAPDTGIPGEVGGESIKRLLRAPAEGKIIPLRKIGDLVKAGEVIAEVEGVPLKAEIPGVLRGLIYPESWVTKGMKVGDIDPRGIREYCFTVSDKARSIGGAVLEAICAYLSKK